MQPSCFAVDSVQAQILDHLLVADLHCTQIQALVAGAQLPVLGGVVQGHPLEWISRGLRQRRAEGDPPRVLHLIAHGRPGAFRIGDVWTDAEALRARAAELAHWGVETIALWSCYGGADAGFVALLEEFTGARVLASADWLGREADREQLQLGDWQLSDLVDPSAWPAQFRLEVDKDKLKPGIYITADNGSHIYLNGKQLKFDLGNGETAPGTWDWRQGFYRPLEEVVLKAGKNVLAIAAWDSEEIAGINSHFKFTADGQNDGQKGIEISTSDTDGWWVYNADTVKDPCWAIDGKEGWEKGCTGLYSYAMTSLGDKTNNGKDVDSTQITGQFPEDEDALINLFEVKNGESPDIPESADKSGLHWTAVDYQMNKSDDISPGLILDGFWVNPGRSRLEGADNPPPWPNNSQTNQTPSDTWLWYGERSATTLDKNEDNPWTFNNLSLFGLEFNSKFAIMG